MGLRLLAGCFTGPLILILFSSLFLYSQQPPESNEIVPRAEREFRAVWVATVDNIDWPSRPGLSTLEQTREAIAILDTAVALNLNAIIFQVRPHCDAFYPSAIEPWSVYLTGTQGQAPNPYYDPLKFWIEQAHDRGLELHAWLNPYRAHHPKGGEVAATSVVNTRPGLVKKLENGYYWLDPAKNATQDYSFRVVMDVLMRYDIDGIHFDDYFYPYGDGNFPDDDTWAKYQAAGGSMQRKDWRRDAVNRFIYRIYQSIKERKAHVKFGVSPFGIWRPQNPESIDGYDQYDKLYADARLWLNRGWIDYWTPQLYWPISQVPQSYPVLLGWWLQENHSKRNIWPGMFTIKLARNVGNTEILNQIMVTRGFVPKGSGHVHFSMKAFLQNTDSVNIALKSGPYRRQALVPSSPWLDDLAPAAPSVTTVARQDSIVVSWTHDNSADVFRWVVYCKHAKTSHYTILNRNAREYRRHAAGCLGKGWAGYAGNGNRAAEPGPATGVSVSAVDRMGNESEKRFLPIQN